MKFWLKQVAVALDQLLNALFGGWADETMSSRCHRKHPVLAKIIDMILWFDKNHCYESYISERDRNQQPPEFRND